MRLPLRSLGLFGLASVFFAGAVVRPARAENSAYYHQFDYQKETDDDGDGEVHVQWRELETSLNEVAITPNRIVIVNASLYLLPNQQYVFFYNEMLKTRANEGAPWEFPGTLDGFCPVVRKGTWSSPDQNLVTESEFYGEPGTFDSRAGVKLMLTGALRTSEVKGQSFIFDYGISNVPIEQVLDNPFCRSAHAALRTALRARVPASVL